jgi:hypothetical protein
VKRDIGPWSWRALPLAGLVTGGLMLPLTYAVSRFRTGLDADLNPMWARFSFLDVAVGTLIIALVASVLIGLAYGFARRLRLGRTGFLLAAAMPVLIALFVVEFAGSGDVAYTLSYPPNWLMPLAVAVGLAAGALSYLDAARVLKARP